eukprot:CAMPEP_0172444922 /NCGR_PEP_ID=MMETSP1065-20121228/4935_1 /TAXON_ID=265537 /ORGANISM="Amphiprora paludosa, Strain CCMP125" /LENGTH=83 /DNA_ID=CAMNT_0013195685 /DNA_START=17 /DNA_END=268 /DNA_ORIENTATION=+
MKFQASATASSGSVVAWNELEHAMAIAVSHGYHCRAKHFFNNKNEVTLMLHDQSIPANQHEPLRRGVLGSAMYASLIPNNEER